MNIGIIGFGHLGSALASGLVRSGVAGNGELTVCDNSHAALEAAKAPPINAVVSQDVNYIIENSKVVFLTVKKQAFEELAAAVDRSLLSGKIIVSFMAGVKFEEIYRLIGDVTLVRAMPSLAISTCEGVTGYTVAPPEVADIFNKLGYAFETEPDNIERVMAFSSCGLGFAAYLIDAFAEAGQTMGFSKEEAINIATATFRNAVDRGAYFETVKAVATPGGATEQGVLHMDDSRVYKIIAEAVNKAYKRMA